MAPKKVKKATAKSAAFGKKKGGYLVALGTADFRKDGTYRLESPESTVVGKRARRIADSLLETARADHSNIVAFIFESNGVATLFASATAGKAATHIAAAQMGLQKEMTRAKGDVSAPEAATPTPEVTVVIKKKRGRPAKAKPVVSVEEIPGEPVAATAESEVNSTMTIDPFSSDADIIPPTPTNGANGSLRLLPS